jgi:hypothetical protein
MNRDEIRKRRSLLNVSAKYRRIGGPIVLLHQFPTAVLIARFRSSNCEARMLAQSVALNLFDGIQTGGGATT